MVEAGHVGHDGLLVGLGRVHDIWGKDAMITLTQRSRICRRSRFRRHSFPGLTFGVEHLGDVQELLSHLESGVQVPDGVILRAHAANEREETGFIP